MIQGLRCNNIEVLECHVNLWFDFNDREKIALGGWIKPAFWWRVIRAYSRLIVKHHSIKNYDILVVGYPGHFDVLIARILTWLRQTPLVWDVLMSLYLITLEREIDKKNHITSLLLYWIENMSCRLPNLLLMDSTSYANWFSEKYKVSRKKIRIVYLGASNFRVNISQKIKKQENIFKVIYYGNFLPSHGVKYILKAAYLLLQFKDIHFILIGSGPELNKTIKLSHKLKLSNTAFLGKLEQSTFIDQISHADLILGTFALTPQANMTIQNKIFEGLSIAKPIITGKSKEIQTIFEHKKNIFIIPRADSKALANAILQLKTDFLLRETISLNGNILYKNLFTTIKIGEQFSKHLYEII